MHKRVTLRRTHVYMFECMYRTSPPRGRTYTQGPAQASADTCAHACANRRCRRAQPAAPHRSPAERVRRSARRRAGSGAYRGQRGDARGVPRADVRVERRRRVERLRAEATTRSTPTGKGSHGSGFRVLGRARSTSPPTRPHTADPSPSHTGARIHNPGRFSHVQING